MVTGASGFGPSPLQGSSLILAPGPYTVTIGAGGSGGCSTPVGNGNDSVFSTITSTGGGHGGSHRSAAQAGGSGGGGAPGNCSAGSGNTPPTDPPQGNGGGGGQ